MGISKNLSLKIETMSFACALFIVLLHSVGSHDFGSPIRNFFVTEGIGGIAVPYYFCVAGYFLAHHMQDGDWWRREIRKRIRTIVVPYLFWCIVSICFCYFLYYCAFGALNNVSITELLRSFSLFKALGLDVFDEPVAPYWFLRTLFLYVTISPMLLLIMRSGCAKAVLCILFVLDIIINVLFPVGYPLWLFWRRFISLSGLWYFCAGIHLYYNPMRCSKRTGLCLFGMGLTLVVFWCTMKANGTPISPVFVATMTSCKNLLLLSGFWLVFPVIQLPKFLRGVSFSLYMVHDVVLFWLHLLSKNCFGGWHGTDLEFTVVAIVGLLSSYAMVRLMVLVAPRVALVAFGGRIKRD